MIIFDTNPFFSWIESCGPKDPLPWSTIIPKANSQAVDLLKKLLIIAPWKRITAEQALCHHYLEIYHDTGSEPNCPKKVYFDAGEIERLNIDQLECALLAETSGSYTWHSSRSSSQCDENVFQKNMFPTSKENEQQELEGKPSEKEAEI
ncbi:unnamed protein product [Acanthocheilonema viteae]|uniref:Protein kinase domain-containing protein n=1 Tax=Acanthocheilonema viteae TaxID=6277 RepID=A0A498S9X6_ACAVI|nr:unnamed protein product [Acanthocheilonema viteae]